MNYKYTNFKNIKKLKELKQYSIEQLKYYLLIAYYFEKKLKKFIDHAARNSFKSFRLNERNRRDVDEQLKRNQCVFNKFCENRNKNEHENE